jgi:carbonic anhydrase
MRRGDEVRAVSVAPPGVLAIDIGGPGVDGGIARSRGEPTPLLRPGNAAGALFLVMSATDELVRNNEAYTFRYREPNLRAAPRRRVAVVACMDARIDLHRVLGLAEGDAHVIRNAGGQATDDVIRSLAISQRRMGTTEIILIHHTDCGMAHFTEAEMNREVRAEIGRQPPFRWGAFTNVEADLGEAVATVRSSPFIPDRSQVRGFVLDLQSGRLRELAV